MCFSPSSNWKITANRFYAGGLDGLGILGRVLRVYGFAKLRSCSNYVVPTLVHDTDLANHFLRMAY